MSDPFAVAVMSHYTLTVDEHNIPNTVTISLAPVGDQHQSICKTRSDPFFGNKYSIKRNYYG